MSDDLAVILEVVYNDTPMDKFIKSGFAAEAMVKRLDAALKAKTITMDEALRGLQEIEVYEKKNSVAVQDAIRLQKEATRVAKENAAAAIENARVAKENADKVAQALKEEAATVKAAAAEQERLRTKYDASYTAMKKYAAEVRDLNKALDSGVLSQNQYTAAQQRLSQSLAQGTGIFATNSTHVNQAKSGAQSLGLQVQQAGYQVGDFFVQVTSGTNPLVAFSQQATQLAGFFGGPWGAAIGAGISIVSAFAVVIFKNMDAIKTYEEVLKDLKVNFEDLSATVDILQDDNLEEKFGNLSSIVKELATSVLELDRAMELRNLTLALDKLLSSNIEPTSVQKIIRGLLPGSELGVSQEELSKLTEQNYAGLGAKIPLEQFQIGKADILSTAKSGDVEATLTKINDFFKQIKGDQPFTDMDADLQTLLSTLSKLAIETAQVEAQFNGTAKAAKDAGDTNEKAITDAENLIAISKQEQLVQETILQYGKESNAVDEQKAELAALRVRLSLEEKFAKDGISETEQRLIDSAVLYAYNIEKNTALIEQQADASMKNATDQLAFANQEAVIQETILKFGKDSVEVDKERGVLAALKVQTALEEKFAAYGISEAEQKIIDLAMEAARQHETNAGLIARQADNAQALAQGLREAATAMNALQGFSEGLDKQLGEAIARVNALKTGADAAVAGRVAGLRFDLAQKVKDAYANPQVDRSAVAAMAASDEKTISAIEAKLAEESKIRADTKADSSGGKGPSAETLENRLQELYKYLDAQKQIEAYMIADEEIAYQQREDLLKSALDKKLITLQDYQMMERDLTLRHQKELEDIENKSKEAKLSTVLGSGAQILTALGAHNEKAAKIAKVFGAAQALADTYAGAAAALKLPFPANLAAAASIISAGLGFVSAIKSGGTASASGGGKSVGSVSSSAMGGQTAAPQTVIIQGIKPTDVFTGEQLSTLFDSLYKENRNRGMVFQVAR